MMHDTSKIPLQWRHNGRNGVSNHQPRDYLFIRWFGHRSKKTPKLRVTGLCAGNSPVNGEFLAQRPSNAENLSIGWRHRDSTNLAWYYMVAQIMTVMISMIFKIKPFRICCVCRILIFKFEIHLNWGWLFCTFSCDQAALWTILSERVSVGLSVCTSHLFHNVALTELSAVIIFDKSDVHVKGLGHKSKQGSKQILPQFGHWTVTPVWIHKWPRNDSQNLSWRNELAYYFPSSSVLFQGIAKNKKSANLTPILGFPDDNSSWNLRMAMK